MEATIRFNEEMMKAGILKSADGLKPSKFGKRVTFRKGKKSFTDGPFAETKEIVAGYWIWEVKSMDEAIEWVMRFPERIAGRGARYRDPSVLRAGRFRRGVHAGTAGAGGRDASARGGAAKLKAPGEQLQPDGRRARLNGARLPHGAQKELP